MTQLNQIIAIESGVKSKATQLTTELHRLSQKEALLTGIARRYEPKDEEGDRLPPESTRVQVTVVDLLGKLGEGLTRLFDVELTKEVANQHAYGQIVIGDTEHDVPVTYLLFLEKQLVDIYTFVNKLPTLDPASLWHLDSNTGVYATEPVQTVRTKKVPKNWVRAEATERHPAQVDIYHEDVIVGTWTKIDFSGAIPATFKADLLNRVETLQRAVKFAREKANTATVVDQNIGNQLFAYLFGG